MKCSLLKGTLLHCMWSCSVVQRFWKEVSQSFFHMVSIDLPLKPELFILGIFPDNFVIGSSTHKLM